MLLQAIIHIVTVAKVTAFIHHLQWVLLAMIATSGRSIATLCIVMLIV